MERESSLDERLRKDQEKADAIKERQVRLGHVPPPSDEDVEEVEEPKVEEESETKTPAPATSKRARTRAKTVK